MKRFGSTLYLPQRRNSSTRSFEADKDGYLFARGQYRTKIRKEDLPEWFVYGYMYGQHGYISAKGVKYLVYKPNYITNHVHKDDILYISYDQPIEPEENTRSGLWYTGYDNLVYGPIIVDFLKAVSIYSNYDVSEIMAEVEKKEQWYMENYGDLK